MFRLRIGYSITGITTGLFLLISFLWSLPDGKLHLVFCDVGQGDAVYIRFPDGRDMVVDGGPNNKVMDCLGRHMPFWDRHIDLVLMTHPQKDHMQGLITVFERYRVDHFVRSDIDNTTEGYKTLQDVVQAKKIPVRFVTTPEKIAIGTTTLSMLWPNQEQIAKAAEPTNVLGATIGDLNDYSIVFFLRYGNFDALFTGDADSRVEANYTGIRLADESLELLKVPHHGSKTGMTKEFVAWLRPKISVISVGNNSYGHPSSQALELLKEVGSKIIRTDEEGDIEVISDGMNWSIETNEN